MIFRRAPVTWPTAILNLPCYRCDRCEVQGRGERCWCCGTDDVTAVPGLWLAGFSGAVIPRTIP